MRTSLQRCQTGAGEEELRSKLRMSFAKTKTDGNTRLLANSEELYKDKDAWWNLASRQLT